MWLSSVSDASSASPIAVCPAFTTRGMLSTASAKARASASEAISVQSVITSCAPAPDQSSSEHRLALAGPPIRPAMIVGSRRAAAMPPAIRPNSS